MTLNVCPADTVHAPLDRVWELLMHPAGYGRFWDLTVDRVEPSHVLPVWCRRQQPAHVYTDGRAKLHVALWVRLHLPAWMAGLVVGASGFAQLS